uniref:Uncharacterized protein n=1 Tax=Fundulus heteroclitus TaxID=8078 RepID=A0A146SHD6_FUNHE
MLYTCLDFMCELNCLAFYRSVICLSFYSLSLILVSHSGDEAIQTRNKYWCVSYDSLQPLDLSKPDCLLELLENAPFHNSHVELDHFCTRDLC